MKKLISAVLTMQKCSELLLNDCKMFFTMCRPSPSYAENLIYLLEYLRLKLSSFVGVQFQWKILKRVNTYATKIWATVIISWFGNANDSVNLQK